MVAVLHAAGASALVDDGEPRTRRVFLPHVALTLGGGGPSPDPILDEMAVTERKSLPADTKESAHLYSDGGSGYPGF